MRILRADLFSEAILKQADAIAISTNGIIKANGLAVMGAGVAKAAAQRWPDLPARLAAQLRVRGNHVSLLKAVASLAGPLHLVSFPTKHDWKDDSDPALIVRSAEELKAMADAGDWRRVYAPPFGCGNGRLRWAEVEPLLAPILNDRFWICSLPI